MEYVGLPYYLSKKLIAANLLVYPLMPINEIIRTYALLKLTYPSLAMRGLYDLVAWCNQSGYPDLSQQKFLRDAYRDLPPIYPKLADNEVLLFMQQAYELAQIAASQDEVPVGAVIVYNNQIIARGYNKTKQQNSSLLHAEIIALEQAFRYFGDGRSLNECDMFVTLEPCVMCSGAIINSRLKRVYYGAKEFKTGACASQYHVFDNAQVNHHTEVIGGIMSDAVIELMQQFFHKLRTG